jgi:hypothetical protein
MVGAGHRPGSYARRDSPDHEWLVRWIETEPRWREVMAEEAGLGAAMESLTHRYEARLQAIHRLLLWPAHAALAACGLHPRSLGLLVRLGGRGAEIREHARLTGAWAGEH